MNEYGEYFVYGSEKYDKEHPDKPKNIAGCIKNGISESTAKMIWDKMVKFASYAFNKSHATCYAALGIRTAYLACHYPTEFMTGMLNSYIGNNDKLAHYITNCNRNGIEILPPDVNLSGKEFEIINDNGQKKIIFGLSGIKGLGEIAAEAIIEERNINGDFKSIEDFLVRTAGTKVNKKAIEALIYTGGFDAFNQGNRKELIMAVPNMLKLVKEENKRSKAQISLFDTMEEKDFNLYAIEIQTGLKDFSPVEIAFNEKEYLGYFVKHPMTVYSKKLDAWRQKNFLSDISEIINETENSDGKLYRKRIAGLVQDKKIIPYKDKYGNAKQLLTFMLNDETGTVKCVGFDEMTAKYGHLIDNNSVVYLLCNCKNDNFGVSCEVQAIHMFSEDEKD